MIGKWSLCHSVYVWTYDPKVCNCLDLSTFYFILFHIIWFYGMKTLKVIVSLECSSYSASVSMASLSCQEEFLEFTYIMLIHCGRCCILKNILLAVLVFDIFASS